MKEFFKTLRIQRWDDHRFYHHSRINQSLHFVSAISFIVAYVYLFINPVVSGIIGWTISMSTRQLGHFVFEPQGFDTVNQVSNEYKEEIKVGYNLFRKIILISACLLVPMLAYFYPQAITWLVPEAFENTPVRMIGMAWVYLGAAGLMFRVLQLCFKSGPMQAFAWATKILTDPFHDIILYHKSPLYLLKGELIDPMEHVLHARQSH
jgi:hypothetical protein